MLYMALEEIPTSNMLSAHVVVNASGSQGLGIEFNLVSHLVQDEKYKGTDS